MEKVFVVNGVTDSLYDDGIECKTASVHTTENGALIGMRKEIDRRCEFLKNELQDKFNDEDYADNFDGYDTFDEYWDDLVKNNFLLHDPKYWSYSNDEISINIYVQEVELCD